MRATVLVATWEDGVFVLADGTRLHELAGRAVRGLTADRRGGALAIVDKNTLRRRSAQGQWSTLATAACDLSCCVAVGDAVYVGSDTASVFRWDAEHGLLQLAGFERVLGRDTWFAGQAVVEGRVVGPPLGVRSIAAAPDGALFANVHVGGIPRSRDGGVTWEPTIEVNSDVHEVRAHPSRPGLVMAAAAVGLCSSSDGGTTWRVQHEGMHVAYCSALAFVGEDVLIAAAESPFASSARLYRRAVASDEPLRPLSGELPEWTQGIVDTQCIGVNGACVAFADSGGNVYLSLDSGFSWSRLAQELPFPSSVVVAGA